MISETYRELNKRLHADEPHFGNGATSKTWFGQVEAIANSVKAQSILDYGCGKGALGAALPHLMIDGYDPAVPGRDEPPAPVDLVISLDVLEHVEPEFVDAVLDDLKRCAVKGVFLVISTRPAGKTLADGRNAHLSVHPPEWWVPKLMGRWKMMMFSARHDEFAFFGVARVAAQEERAAA